MYLLQQLSNFTRPISLRRWLFAAAILGITFGVACWAGLYARKWREADRQVIVEGLMVPTDNLNIGEVWEEKDFAWRLPIRNATGDTIQIHKFNTSCSCTAIEPARISIRPGETATVNLTIDLMHLSDAVAGVARRPFALSVQPVTSLTRQGGFGWQIHGTVRSRVTLDAKTVHFGDQPIRGQTAVTRQVLATVHIPCQGLKVAVNPLVATVTVNRREDAPERFEITVAANPNLPPGNFQTDAKINVVEPNGKHTLAFMLPIAGTMRSEVRLLPERILLEPRPIGETADAIVTLHAPPDANVVIDHIETDDPGLTAEAATIPGIPACHAFRVRQRVEKEGEQTVSMRFVLRGRGDKLTTLPVQMCYRGVAVKKPATDPTRSTQP